MSFLSIDGIFRAFRDVLVATDTPMRWSLAVAGLVVLGVTVTLARVSRLLSPSNSIETVKGITITVTGAVVTAALALFSISTLFEPHEAFDMPATSFATPEPLPSLQQAAVASAVPSYQPQYPTYSPTEVPEPIETATPTHDPTEAPYVQPAPTETPKIGSAFNSNGDEDNGWVEDQRARYLAKPLVPVLADASNDFAHYRSGTGPPYKTWTIFTDFACKIGNAPMTMLPEGRLSLQCASYKTFFPDAAKQQVSDLTEALGSVMNAGTVYVGSGFRDWNADESLHLQTALVYIGARYFPDGTHIVLEVIPNP